jgi:hypothetical protein
MSADLNAQALDLALAGAPPTGDAELDAAVARAAADIAAIRAGLALIAAQLPTGEDDRVFARRPSLRRVMALVAVVVVVVLGAVGGWVALGRGGGSGSAGSSSSLQFVLDRFDFVRPGVLSGFPPLGAFPEYSVPQLSDISASSANDAWIVGSVAWRWDGSRWRSVALPAVSGSWSLSSVVTLGPGDAWAVGLRSAPSDLIVATHPLVEHWDGTRWSVIPMPLPGAGAFTSVSADAPNDVWAVGWWVPKGTNRHRADAAIRPLIAHWDGHRWHVTHVPARRADAFSQVIALSRNDVWVAGPGIYQNGTPIVRRWDGTRWRSIRAPFGRRDGSFRLTATSPSDAWAVGGQLINCHVETLAAHWDGHTWMIARPPIQNTDSMLLDVHAISPSDVWALGRSGFVNVTHPKNCNGKCTEIRTTTPVAIYEHWNGHRWSLAPVSSQREGLATLTAAADGTVWAAGGCISQNIITRWNGHTWQPVPHPPDITWDPTTPQRDRNPPATSCLSKSPR